MTSSPLIAPHATPVSSTPATPSAVGSGAPTTIHDAKQLVSTKVIPTDRSMPAVITTNACAIATNASRTPLLAAVCTTLAVNPAGWFAT